jgi:protocatechuate 3,4-dioxygenase beta subunit
MQNLYFSAIDKHECSILVKAAMTSVQSFFDRRNFMRAAGAAAALVLTRCGGSSNSTSSSASTANSGACVLTPELTIGPYFVDERLFRSDLTTNTTDPNVINGVPLNLTLQVVNYTSNGCSPLASTMVDVWHADAAGVYSDEPSEATAGQTFLRGYQLTDANGLVTFKTIYPGWYPGRTVHIHVMVRVGASASQFTTQLFFDDSLTDTIFANAPYNARGARDTRNLNDGIYSSQTQLTLTKDSSGAYSGSMLLGVPS